MELELIYNEETQAWEERPEPFITIEVETEEEFEFIGTAVAFYNKHLEAQEKPKTNADRIRAMSDEELALFVRAFINSSRCPYDWKGCENCWLKELCNANAYNGELEWLQQPPKGE